MRIEVARGDITREQVDAVVSSTSSALMAGGGVCGAIHRAAGPALAGECRQVRRTIYPDGLPVGGAVATRAGMLAARWVIHTVGPDARRGETDPSLLAACFVSCLREAADLGVRSVAFPAVGAGARGWDPRVAARVAIDAIRDVAERDGAGSVETVRFVLLDEDAWEAFRGALEPMAVAGSPS